jgi:NAD(P)-dependent dehydrogenase (short-subunit alcohol dehydrogenase family)
MDSNRYGRGADRLQGRVAIVTGAGSRAEGIGNGRASAILMARNGARVVLVDQVDAWAQRTRELVEAEGGQGHVVVADVSKPDDCRRVVDQAVAQFGGVDILVNNVGITGALGTAVEVDPVEWEESLRINVTSMMLMAKVVVPQMVARGAGSIINIASVAGLKGGTPHLLYPTSKGAVVNMTRAMAAHHGAEGIRVNCVCPGMLHTPMMYAGGMSEAQRESRRKRSILQTEGSGWDTGAAVLFLASDDARWITGAILPVDAGATAATPRV